MKIFLIGDYYSGTGPANVTLELKKHLPGNTAFLKFKNKILRLVELFIKTPGADICLISGYSKQNLWAIRFARLFGKKTVYLMHGCVEHENQINGVPDAEMNRVERATLAGCDMILAVSEQFEDWLKDNYSEHSDKISHLTNGVDWTSVTSEEGMGPGNTSKHTVVSVGGGMPRKKIKYICEAVEKLTGEGFLIELIVAGDKGLDSDAINNYGFVRNVGIVSSRTLGEYYASAELFIQNSCFETFGLAPLEAIACGCSLLLSKQVGAISVFEQGTFCDDDLIDNCEDSDEIAEKIRGLLQKPNYDRLMSGIDKENTSWESVCARLLNILNQMLEKE